MEDQLKRLSTWTKFLGWLSLILGGLAILVGILNLFILNVLGFITCIISGGINLFFGKKLVQASKEAKALMTDETRMPNLVNELATYFMAQGIYTIISFVLGLIMIILLGSFIFSLAGNMAQISSMM